MQLAVQRLKVTIMHVQFFRMCFGRHTCQSIMKAVSRQCGQSKAEITEITQMFYKAISEWKSDLRRGHFLSGRTELTPKILSGLPRWWRARSDISLCTSSEIHLRNLQWPHPCPPGPAVFCQRTCLTNTSTGSRWRKYPVLPSVISSAIMALLQAG